MTTVKDAGEENVVSPKKETQLQVLGETTGSVNDEEQETIQKLRTLLQQNPSRLQRVLLKLS